MKSNEQIVKLHEILKSGRISHNICTPLFVGISPSIEPETVNTSAQKHGSATVLKGLGAQHQTLPFSLFLSAVLLMHSFPHSERNRDLFMKGITAVLMTTWPFCCSALRECKTLNRVLTSQRALLTAHVGHVFQPLNKCYCSPIITSIHAAFILTTSFFSIHKGKVKKLACACALTIMFHTLHFLLPCSLILSFSLLFASPPRSHFLRSLFPADQVEQRLRHCG